MRSRLVFVLLLCLLPAALRALEVPPAPKRWATDAAGILSTTELAMLDSKLENFEQSQGTQFIVYLFPSIEGDSIEEFTIRCVKAWRVGQAKYDNGLVLFVFHKERKIRVEVGHGLEGTITDAFSSRVIRDVIAPHFQRNAYGEGLRAGADAIIQKIRTGEEPVPPLQPNTQVPAGSSGSAGISPFTIVIILFVVFFIILPMLSRRRGGGCGGCMPLFFFPFGGGGITFGGGGGGFSGGGGFGGGGGFSGGGGSFGGGGATGGW